LGSVKLHVEANDGDTLYRTSRFTVNGVELRTPLKGVDIAKIGAAGLRLGEPTIAEAYREIAVSDLRKAMSSTAAHAVLARPLRQAEEHARAQGAVTMHVLQLDDSVTDERQLEYVENLAYSGSDIVSVPLVEDLQKRVQGKNKAFRTYVDFVHGFLEEVARLNHKPIMGTLPPLPWSLSRELADIYLDAGVTGYLVDFAGRTPSVAESQGLRQLLKRLKEEDLLESTLFYGLNANTGRAQAKRLGPGIVAAKDILSFGFNVDVLGLKHTPLRGPQEMYDKMAAAGPSVRIFDRKAYAYRDVHPRDAASVNPNSAVPRTYFASDATWDKGKLLMNMEQQSLEAQHLRNVVKEGDVARYLAGKSAFEAADLGRFKAARQDLKRGQTSLGNTDWGL